MITVESVPSEFGDITIFRSRWKDYYMYSQHKSCQSIADYSGVSLASYIHAIYGLITQTDAHSILLIGCGGGTLGTMLTRAGRSVTIVDIDPLSFTLAQRYFSLPEEVECRALDGRTFLERSEASYDVIVVDAFIGEDIPDQFCSVEFFTLARERLNVSGYILFNVLVEHDFDYTADTIAAGMAEAGFKVRVLDAARQIGRNTIVAGGNVAKLHRPTLVVDPAALRDEVDSELEQMRFRPRRIPPGNQPTSSQSLSAEERGGAA